MTNKYKVTIAALCCITVIECLALYLGYDKVILTTVIGAICGLAGYAAPRPKFLKEE